jgi:uncharacterized protein (TIGR02246 family)
LNSLFAFEQDEIESIIQDYTHAWNLHEGRGFGANFTEDADFVNIFGDHFSGKDEIEKRHVAILQTFLKGSILEILDTRLREVQPGLVIALVRWKIQNPVSLKLDNREGIFTQVFIQSSSTWQITASQNTLIPN